MMTATASAARSRRIKALLSRLHHDQAGNMMMIMGAAIFPILGMIGGAVDMSRYYMAQYRLQLACDAGALAARRSQSNATSFTTANRQEGEKFFDFNFPAGSYGATSVTRTFSAGSVAGTVNGTTSAVIPVTVMKAFLFSDQTLNVTCFSTLNIPNTDVMFVLDVTGSMNDTVSGVRKIDGLKAAVKDFYLALGPGAPSGAGRIRYGFVPYAANVNVGKIVFAANPAWIQGGQGTQNWSYQSRVPVTFQRWDPTYGAWGAPTGSNTVDGSTTWSGTWTYVSAAVGTFPRSVSNVTYATCNARAAPPATAPVNSGSATTTTVAAPAAAYPDATQTRNMRTDQPRSTLRYRYGGTSGSGTSFGWTQTSGSGASALGTCRLMSNPGTLTRTTTYNETRSVTWTDMTVFDRWNYQQISVNVSPAVQTASMVNPAFWDTTLPTNRIWGTAGDQNGGIPSTLTWAGCIEEADTINTITSTSPLTVPAGANDINIDLIPSSDATRWKPFLPDMVYRRDSSTSFDYRSDASACPVQASRLRTYTDVNAVTGVSTSFAAYVDTLSPSGNTYHDIGMVWGARFLSPTGIFAADNADSTGPGGFPISRHLVFMTDGVLVTQPTNYDPWGITMHDGRVAPTSASTNTNNAAHRRRMEIVCNEAKGKGFTIWVIGFGITTLPADLAACASDADHASVATDTAALRARFQTIAQTIGGLRLSE